MTPSTVAAALVVLACSSSPTPSVPLGTGVKMCDALTPEDLKAQGLSPKAKPSTDSWAPKMAYCVYAEQTGGKEGGIELDVYAATPGPDALKAQKFTLVGLREMQPAGYSGVDESLMNLDAKALSGRSKFAVLVVRRGGLVFSLSLPSGPKAKDQLFALAALVLQRLR